MNKIKILLVCIFAIILLILFFIDDSKDDSKDDKSIYIDDILSKYQENDKLIYIEDFLSKDDYHKILSLDTDKSKFKNEKYRLIKPLSPDNISYQIFYSDQIINALKQKLDNNKIMKSDFPIEHRIYPEDSKGMDWHVDTLMYDVPQYEVIYTIRNMSKSLTGWKDDDDKYHKIWTKPNSLLVVKAEGYGHHVTPPISGEREILKLIYTQSKNINNNYRDEITRFNFNKRQ